MRNTQLIKRLAAIKETPIVPDWVMESVNGKPADLPANATKLLDELEKEGGNVEGLRFRLEGLPPSWKLEATLL